MSALARKFKEEPQQPVAQKANVVALAPKSVSRIDLRKWGAAAARNIIPPFIVLAVLLGIWQLLCSAPGSSLPPRARSSRRATISSYRRSSITVRRISASACVCWSRWSV